LGRIDLGIPAEQTERIVSVTRIQNAVCETENQEIFISMSALFRQKDAPHGIVLKTTAERTVKTTLLTPKINTELEIQEKDIQGLPRAMGGVYRHFKGAYCTGKNVILILDPKKITEGAL